MFCVCGGATAGHLDAALCRPLVASLCSVRETGREEGVWRRAEGCARLARRSVQCLQQGEGGRQMASSLLLGDTWGHGERIKSERIRTESS